MTAKANGEFSPVEGFPQNPEFYRQALDMWPSPMLIVDAMGTIIYGNRALVEMGGWQVNSGLGTNVLNYLHPDEIPAMTEAFVQLTSDALEREPGPVAAWATVQSRLVAANGQTIPIMLTGMDGLQEPGLEGIIYDIRPAYEQDILRRGLVGLAQGEPIDSILKLIAEMIALPPLPLDAAVIEPRGDGSYRVVGATNEVFDEILQEARDPLPWNVAGSTPERTLVSQFPGDVGEDLFAAGYREFWHVAPEASTGPESYRIVAAGPIINRPATGPIDRLSRANELAGVVLLRARADALLEHSATHDRLTELPNREGFYRRGGQAMDGSTSLTAAALFIDLDGFKQINDDHGHAAGDRVLQIVASRLRLVTRSVDLIARLGGDEFVILVGASEDRPANRQRVEVIAHRTLLQIARDIEVPEAAASVNVQASVGAAIAGMPIALEDLVAAADSAMYEAKRQGGNNFHIIEHPAP